MVAHADPSASTPADRLTALFERLLYHKVIYTVQDTTQLLCYKLSVDLFSVYNSIWFHRKLILTADWEQK